MIGKPASFSVLASILLLLSHFTSLATAKIGSITAPTTPIKPGHTFHVTFHTTDWIINTEQYFALFGITIASSDSQGMGLVLNDGYNIAKHGYKLTGYGAFNVSLKIPADFEPPAKDTEYVLRAAVVGTAGIAEATTFDVYSANITVV